MAMIGPLFDNAPGLAAPCKALGENRLHGLTIVADCRHLASNRKHSYSELQQHNHMCSNLHMHAMPAICL